MLPLVQNQFMLGAAGLVLFLAFLEGILSIDNAIVLALMARHLPREMQRKALTYGLFGAIIFRLVALAFISHLMRWNWVKYVGGAYLIFVALKHLVKRSEHPETHGQRKSGPGFWGTVLRIEIMDIAFAVDSILAAVALSNRYWIVFTGGFLGVVLMRFAATAFLGLLRRFPSFEATAYLLVLLIGIKLILEALRLPWIDFHSSSQPAPYVFWGLMLLALLSGFRRSGRHGSQGA